MNRSPVRAPGKKENGLLVLTQIRPGAGPDEEWHALVRFAHLIFPRSRIDTGRDHVFITAACEGRLVGFSHIRPTKKGACIRGIGVRPGWRGRGVGTQLLRQSLDLCGREFPGRKIVLKVKAANEEALRLYARHGFVLTKSDGDVHTLARRAPN
ncbi:MAG: GNAT family N-acetyltransferase [Candidatus Micrarchaeota archaeon]